MKAILPSEVKLISYNHKVKVLLDFVNESIKNLEFHYSSKTNTEFSIPMFGFEWMIKNNTDVFDKVIKLLQESGWEARHGKDYCGHGPFYSIFIRTNDINPQKVLEFNDIGHN